MNYFELFAELRISLISSRNIIIRLSNIIYSTNSQVLQSDSPIRTNSIHSFTFYIACIRFILSLKSYFIGQCEVNVRSIKVILLSNIWKGYQTSVKNVLMTNRKRMACQVVLKLFNLWIFTLENFLWFRGLLYFALVYNPKQPRVRLGKSKKIMTQILAEVKSVNYKTHKINL